MTKHYTAGNKGKGGKKRKDGNPVAEREPADKRINELINKPRDKRPPPPDENRVNGVAGARGGARGRRMRGGGGRVVGSAIRFSLVSLFDGAALGIDRTNYARHRNYYNYRPHRMPSGAAGPARRGGMVLRGRRGLGSRTPRHGERRADIN